MSKPLQRSRPGPAARVAREVRSFSARLTDQSVIDACVGLLIVITLSLLLVRTYRNPHIDLLAPDSVANTDIIAPEDLKVVDAQETKRLRDQASAAVPPVFDFSTKAAREARATIQELFAAGRDASTADAEVVRQKIEERTGIQLESEHLAVLMRHHFSDDLEQLMIEHLESVMMSPIVNSRSQLRRLGATSISLLKNGQEVAVSDLSTVRDKLIASASLRSEKLVWPASYDPHERRLLGEILGSLVLPNTDYNERETELRRRSVKESIPEVNVTVERGQPIVTKGETVTPLKAALLLQAAKKSPIGQRAIEFAGTFVIVTLLVLVLWQYLYRYQRKHIRVRRHFLLQIVCFFLTVGLSRLFFTMGSAMSHWAADPPFNEYMAYSYLAPLAVGAVMVTVLTDAHAAFVFSATVTVFIGVLTGNVYLATYTLVSSAGAIYHLQHTRDRSSLVKAGGWIGLVNAAAAIALDLLGANQPHLLFVVFDAFCGFTSGLLAAMVGSIVLPMFEWLFQITTSFKLLELSNLNLPLLRQLAERAPGTYHHSIVVGLLAEAGAEAIGGDALFARVACLYHDIGKTVRPTYFVENQTYMDNRHDRLSPKMSSIVLANHVKQGIEIAREHKLPPRIVSIIPEHHGTGLMKYFYYKARKESDDPDAAMLEHEFRYPGPKPQSKEAAIIMIADSVEAAARTVPDPTPPKLRNMIDTIITRIRDDGQFDECDITLRELRIVTDSFVKVLMGIHHHRIAYPGFDFSKPGSTGSLLAEVPRSQRALAEDSLLDLPAAERSQKSNLRQAGGD
jgi:putative nucleotidyltransferase with HDIG domain